MEYLLDTHVILWCAQGNENLPARVCAIMRDEECVYSIASLWEIAIKQSLQASRRAGVDGRSCYRDMRQDDSTIFCANNLVTTALPHPFGLFTTAQLPN